MGVKLVEENNIVLVQLDYPRTNSLDLTCLDEIKDVLCRIEAMEHINTVILASGLPFGFSSGLDLGGLFVQDEPYRTGENICKAVRAVYTINRKILSSRKIFIASLHGPVIGSAASMAICCDLCIAAENTWFWIPEPQYGGLAADGVIEVLSRKIGISRASALLLTNDRINGRVLYDWGLFYRILQKEKLEQEVWAIARRLSGYSNASMALTKEFLNSTLKHIFEEEKLLELLNSAESYNRLQPYVMGKNSSHNTDKQGGASCL